MQEQVTKMKLPNRLQNGAILRLILGGAALQRCDNSHRSNAALAGEGCDSARTIAPTGSMTRRNSPSRVLYTFVLTAAVFLFLGAGDTDARFKDLGHRMMCTCGCGQILLECNHVGCKSSDKMRDQLLASIDKGNNDDLVLQGFVQEYGPTVIAAPTATGFNRIAWVMPFVVLAIGIAFAVHIVRSWKNRPEPALADGIAIPSGSELEEFRRRARKETDL
jgi:cytochrome c-type biogenesis protein CcmH